jgi:hypothetical protein
MERHPESLLQPNVEHCGDLTATFPMIAALPFSRCGEACATNCYGTKQMSDLDH